MVHIQKYVRRDGENGVHGHPPVEAITILSLKLEVNQSIKVEHHTIHQVLVIYNYNLKLKVAIKSASNNGFAMAVVVIPFNTKIILEVNSYNYIDRKELQRSKGNLK